MSADFTGVHEPDLDGCRVALVATVHSYGGEVLEAEAAYGFVAMLPHRKTALVAEALDAFDGELTRLGRDRARCVVRFHTDVDKSFLGRVQKLALRKGWAQTDTGGYRSRANGIAERRIGMLKQTARTLLLSASGGGSFHVELWGHALKQANFCCNVNPWTDRRAPYSQLTGSDYVWGPEDHVFGEMVTFLVPESCRDDAYRPPGERGIWMRRDCPPGGSGSAHSAVVVPVEWDMAAQSWILLPSVVTNSFKVHRGVFPLRMRPPPGSDGAGFDAFVDAVMEPLLVSSGSVAGVGARFQPGAGDGMLHTLDSGPDSDSESEEGDFEVERILNSREVAGVLMYLVKWKGYSRKHNSWEPASAVNADDLVAEYRARIGDTGCAYTSVLTDPCLEGVEAVLAQNDSALDCSGADAEVELLGGADVVAAAVAELHRKQKMPGAPEDFVEPYLDEFANVRARRLVQLSREEAARVRAETLVPRLRMLLAVKRDGRRKCRLVLQGFSEPEAWDEGRSVDSPVAYHTSVRLLLAKSGAADVISKRDVSVAFLQSDAYGSHERLRYCSYRPCRGADDVMYRLLGPLYGQRSASRRWFETMSNWLLSEGFVQGKNEPCLFVHPCTGLSVVVYVDDIITRGGAKETAAFHGRLGNHFQCTEEEYLAVDRDLDFLGFTVSLEVEDGEVSVYMSQSEAIRALLADFDREQVPMKSSPMPTRALFHSDPCLLTANATAVYKHVVGALNYLVRCTRYDIGYPVSRLSSKMSAPDVGAWKSLLHLLGYLRCTADFRIGGSLSSAEDCFEFYVDSDHCSDSAHTTRSQTGYIIFLNSFPVDWASRRQPVTAVSPAEAEIYAMREAVVAGRLVLWVAEELGIKVTWPFAMKSDSTQAVSFQRATAPNSKLRRCFDMRNAAVAELRDQGVVVSEHILRDFNVADLLTHCLSGPNFRECLGRAQNLR
jgi:hypothetical protein